MRPELDDTHAAGSPGGQATPASPSKPAHTRTQTGARVQHDPEGARLSAGFRLGHFRIERRLGAGGMGEVYLATDLALDRPVAIKVLPDARRARLRRAASA